jgi:predicted phosphate transport protein (TIGR00153 family)
VGLFSKDTTFFEILESQADTACRTAQALQTLVKDFSNRAEHARRIDALESEGDTLAHRMANKVDSTFVTPLDKEDLQHFSNKLDDIIDFIDACSARMILYEIREPRPDMEGLVQLLVDTTVATREAVSGLRTLKARDKIHDNLVRIHELENQGDRAFRSALSSLFNAPDANPIEVLKWKEVYDRIELAIDQCEDVANLVESAVIKYA